MTYEVRYFVCKMNGFVTCAEVDPVVRLTREQLKELEDAGWEANARPFDNPIQCADKFSIVRISSVTELLQGPFFPCKYFVRSCSKTHKECAFLRQEVHVRPADYDSLNKRWWKPMTFLEYSKAKESWVSKPGRTFDFYYIEGLYKLCMD